MLLLLQLSQATTVVANLRMNLSHNTDACRPGLIADVPFYATPGGLTASRPQQTAVTKLTVDPLHCQHGRTLRFGYVLMIKDTKLALDDKLYFTSRHFVACVPPPASGGIVSVQSYGGDISSDRPSQ